MRKAALIATLFIFPTITFASTYGSNFLTGGTCSAKSEDSAPYSCDKAFDGNNATKWSSGSANNFPAWIKYDLGVGNEKRLDKSDIYVTYSPIKTYTLEGSNNDSTWDLLNTNITADATGDYYAYPTSSVAYRYFRLNVLDRWNSGTNYAEIYEWTGYECVDCGGGSTTSSTSANAESVYYAGTALIYLIFLTLFAGSILIVVNFYRSRINRK